jgi:hypothetical protein
VIDRKMTIPPFVITSELEGVVVVLNLNSKRYYLLNETAGFIWRGISEGKVESEIVDTMFLEYDSTKDHLTSAVSRVFSELERAELIT